jgi:V8-like Glu-specific endopeptidase
MGWTWLDVHPVSVFDQTQSSVRCRNLRSVSMSLLFTHARRKVLALSFISGLTVLIPSLMTAPMAQANPPIGVLGNDDRVTLPYDMLRQSGRKPVGQLEILKADGFYYTCTFTVIGERLGLTNAHCMLDEQGRPPIAAKGYALRYGNKRFTSAKVLTTWTGTDRYPETTSDLLRDWAIVRFNKKIGRKTGTFGNMPWSTDISQAGESVVGTTVDHIGYSGDWPTAAAIKPGEVRGKTPAAHLGCKIVEVNNGLLVHTCDGTPGASGTGIHDAQGRLHGLDVATLTNAEGEMINVAVPLERFMPAIESLRKKNHGRGIRVPRI